jgi:hypothetical protein
VRLKSECYNPFATLCCGSTHFGTAVRSRGQRVSGACAAVEVWLEEHVCVMMMSRRSVPGIQVPKPWGSKYTGMQLKSNGVCVVFGCSKEAHRRRVADSTPSRPLIITTTTIVTRPAAAQGNSECLDCPNARMGCTSPVGSSVFGFDVLCQLVCVLSSGVLCVSC